MTHSSIEPRDHIFVKRYGFLFFLENISKNIGKNVSKNLSGKNGQKLLGYAKLCVTNALKTGSERVI